MVTRHDRGRGRRPHDDAPTATDLRAEADSRTATDRDADAVTERHRLRRDEDDAPTRPAIALEAPTRPAIALEAPAHPAAALDTATRPAIGLEAPPRVTRWRPRLKPVSRLSALLFGPAGDRTQSALRAKAETFATAAAGALDAPVQLESAGLAHGGAPMAGFAMPVAAGDEILTVRACPGLVAAVVESLTGAPTPPLAERPDPVTAAVLGHGALLLCDALHEAGLSAPRILTGVPPRAEATVDLRVRIGARLGQLQIGLSEAFALRLIETLGRRAATTPTPASPDLAGIRLPVDVCMGPLRLAASTVAALRPGDALCPDPAARLVGGHPAGPVFLRTARRAAGAPVAAADLNGGRLEIRGLALPTPTFTEVPVSESSTPHDTLPVDVHLVLASLPLTLGEIADLGPGSILEVGGALPRVRLQVGDRCIAKGELVDVDGVLGLRILEGGA
jgi:type III secretion system YscQ/HrcQ family protein